MVVTISANRPPSADERLNISSRSGSRPISREQLLGAADAPPRAEIALQEMASAFQAAGHDDAVHAAFEGRQQVVHLDLARTRQPQHADVLRVLQSHGPGQVRRRVGAVVAAKGNDQRFAVHKFTLQLHRGGATPTSSG